jgi:hypothetical protein
MRLLQLRRLLRSLLVGITTFLGVAALAQQVVVIDGERYVVSAEKIHRGKLTDADVTLMGLTLGKHSLKDVQTRLGKAKILPAREHGPSRICYVSDRRSDGTIVLFEAGPLGGWEYLTGFTIVGKETAFPDSKFCTESPQVQRGVATESGIGLEQDLAELRRILGEPTEQQSEKILYLYHAQERLTEEQRRKLDVSKLTGPSGAPMFYDVSSSVQVRLKNRRLILISVYRLESL